MAENMFLYAGLSVRKVETAIGFCLLGGLPVRARNVLRLLIFQRELGGSRYCALGISEYMIGNFFKQRLICPHCKHEFYAPRAHGRSIVQRGALFVCPNCSGTFATSFDEQLFPRAKPWPFWMFILMMIGIVLVLLSPMMLLDWLSSSM